MPMAAIQGTGTGNAIVTAMTAFTYPWRQACHQAWTLL